MAGKSKHLIMISIVYLFVFFAVLEYLPIVSRFIGFSWLFSPALILKYFRSSHGVVTCDVDRDVPTGY